MQSWHSCCSTVSRIVSLESEKEKCWRDKSCLGEWENAEKQDMTRRPWEKVKSPPLSQTQMLVLKLGFQTVASRPWWGVLHLGVRATIKSSWHLRALACSRVWSTLTVYDKLECKCLLLMFGKTSCLWKPGQSQKWVVLCWEKIWAWNKTQGIKGGALSVANKYPLRQICHSCFWKFSGWMKRVCFYFLSSCAFKWVQLYHSVHWHQLLHDLVYWL